MIDIMVYDAGTYIGLASIEKNMKDDPIIEVISGTIDGKDATILHVRDMDYGIVIPKHISLTKEMIKMSNIGLEKGQKIVCTLYSGPSNIETTTLFNWLNSKKENNEPMNLTNTGFIIRITDVKIVEKESTVSNETKSTLDHEPHYKVIIRGVLE